MDQQSYPAPPHLPPPRHSNALTYVVIGIAVVGIMGFFLLLFGQLFLVALAIFLAVSLLAGIHYITWGRALTEAEKKRAKAELERD